MDEKNKPVAIFEGYDGETLKPLFTLIGTLNAGDKLCVCAPAEAAAPSDLQPLKALALAATPGPWDYRPIGETTDPEIAAANGSRVCLLVAADMTKQNSRFIAAANPAVVLDLIARLASAERAYEIVLEEARKLADAAHLARQQAAPSIPEGLKLVPTKATPEMLRAGGYRASAAGLSRTGNEAWAAMIAAAPAHPAMPALLDKPQAEPTTEILRAMVHAADKRDVAMGQEDARAVFEAAQIVAQPSTVTLSGHQLHMALDLINPDGPRDADQLDDELTFGIVQNKDDDGKVSVGMCCWNDDTDGVLPLDGEYSPPAGEVSQGAAPTAPAEGEKA